MKKKSNQDQPNKTKKISLSRIVYVLLITSIGLIYFYYQSIQIYGQQTYHVDLENNRNLFSYINFWSESRENSEDSAEIEKTQLDDQDTSSKLANSHPFKKIILSENDKVFFAGDSLMQGIAPHVKRMLYKEYKIESINLSKQSTGLTYPKAFNWPKTIDDILKKDPLIKLVVIFLGPNDPWSLRVEEQKRYVKFKSSTWEEKYRNRIQSILSSANEHKVQVLWLAIPCMKKEKLNSDVVYLNSLYQSETEKLYQHFLPTNEFLGCTYDEFSDFVEIDNTKIKVRIDDGVHFTVEGQKILANAIMETITVN